MKLILFFSGLLMIGYTNAQSVFLKLVSPAKTQNSVTASRQFIKGTTCKECRLTINDAEVKVWGTGAFAAEVNLSVGDTVFQIVAVDPKGFKVTQKLFYNYQLPAKEKEVTTSNVEYWRIEPQGDLLLKAGDRLKMTIKTLPGSVVKLENGFELTEVPVKDSTGIRGIYRGEYVVKEKDALFTEIKAKLKAVIQTKDEQLIEVSTKNVFALMTQPLILQTKGKLPFLLLGLGEDRLGGAKMGYLDSLVKLYAVSKVGNKYCVQLSKNRQAYIEEEYVDVIQNGSFSPASLTSSMRVWGDSTFDYVSLILYDRLPYQAIQEINPSKIIVDVFGATSNTNWLTQMSSVKEIKNIYSTQIDEDVFRISIELNHAQHWGHSIYYNGNNLVIRVKRQPQELSLNNLVIAVDAGHGGTNKGAFGLTGVMEKDMTLLIAKELQQALEAEGATVIMTRTKDTTYDNHDRLSFYKEKNPDLLLSIHLNSATDPIRIKGVSTYYKYIGYRPLTQTILSQMLGMGLKEFGNVGNFNFILNGITECPNVLVEALFVSNPEDEMNVLTPEYRKQMADKIVLGIKDWLQNCKTAD
ncbi:MAG: N-acetylmuramoyl-L-alanine amidase [Chitinophagaceae bacterium]|nr:N-acetylmuramoyl-L-alanine amidase [Chitinophagaceae bacterium]